MNWAIEVRGLRKNYGNRQILKGVDLSLRRGEILALLGQNGAGKTTALECIEGLRTCDGGSIAINGKTGIQLQSSSLPEHLRVMEAARLFAAWNKVETSSAALDALGIGALAKRQYRELSTGQKRRLHLALALIGKPDILFLDEPTAGLDVAARAALHEQIRRLNSQGKTILLSSHDMAEVETLCDRIAILKDGIIAFTGTVSELNEMSGRKYRIFIRTDSGTEHYESDDILETLPALFRHYRETGTLLMDIRVDRGTLEQHLIEIEKGETR